MNPRIKDVILLLCAIGVIALIPVFIYRTGTIETDMPEFTSEMLVSTAQQARKSAHQQAEQRKVRKLLTCEIDDDCIIVDKDPCGCLVGPQGVTAINASYTFEFNKEMENVMAKACPETEPSQEKECSPTARPVCRENACRIVY